MKRKSVFLLIAAIAVMGLLSGCSDVPENPPGNGNVTVKFDTNGGEPETIPAITLQKGESMGDKYPDDPTKEDYDFDGWYSENTKYDADEPINESITLTAKWIEQVGADEVTVNFNTDGGEPETIASITLQKGESMGDNYPSPDPTKEDYDFGGWYFEDTLYDAEEPINESITLTAKWIEQVGTDEVTVNFNTNGGEPETIPAITLQKGESMGDNYPDDPTKEDYDFGGWYFEDTLYDADEPINESITLTAKWIEQVGADWVTVTFKRNNTDTAGFTEADPPTVDVLEGQTLASASFPTPPTRSVGWGVGLSFDGWYTEDGTVFDETTPVTENIDVLAKWKFQAGTPEVVDETLVHIAPTMTSNQGDGGTQGTWAGSANTDGSWTYTGGAVRYRFPDNIEDYDFFTLELIASSTTSGTISNNGFKQYNTGTDYMPRTGNQYPNIPQNAISSYNFEIRGAGSGSSRGIAIQTNSAVSKTIKWTKVTFSKGVRVPITFDTGTDETIPSITGVVGTAIGSLPAPAANPGYTFGGWTNSEGAAVSDSTLVIAGGMALIAKWNVEVSVTQISVDFTEETGATITPIGGTVTERTATSFTFSKTTDYAGGWVKFAVPLADGATLSAYKSVTVTINGSGNDPQYKPVLLLAGTPLPNGRISPDPSASASYCMGTASSDYQSGTQTKTITINAAKAGSLSGTVEFSIYLHANASSSSPTVYTFSNVKINVE